MNNKGALKPDVFASFSDLGVRTPQEKEAENDPDDIALSGIANHEGWTVLNEYIESMKREMDALIQTLISEGGSFEDVGKITVVANLAKEKLYAVQRRVSDAVEATG